MGCYNLYASHRSKAKIPVETIVILNLLQAGDLLRNR
jgi:hypothetical protein